jgi:hypothetical protein
MLVPLDVPRQNLSSGRGRRCMGCVSPSKNKVIDLDLLYRLACAVGSVGGAICGMTSGSVHFSGKSPLQLSVYVEGSRSHWKVWF